MTQTKAPPIAYRSVELHRASRLRERLATMTLPQAVLLAAIVLALSWLLSQWPDRYYYHSDATGVIRVNRWTGEAQVTDASTRWRWVP